MKLMGVDVGFSKTRKTTAIACLDDELLSVERARTDWDSRRKVIPDGFRPTVVAVDGPLLPGNADRKVRRSCESLLAHKPFHIRCKPGFSHFGNGLRFRQAADELCECLKKHLSKASQLVEAFPNAFLAMLLPNEVFVSAPRLERGKRFDWLYDTFVSSEALHSLKAHLDIPVTVWTRLQSEKDHEKRAALVCLLTAACVTANCSMKVGDAVGGWFCLPPPDLLQPWALDGLKGQQQ